ncbi:MAG: hypothetical protein NZ108_01160 [Bacteroidia bacterium]|nr:hypothetical protein [Bacteroidia bacterium]
MAQFIPFAPNVEVNGQTVLSIVKAISAGQELRMKILEKHGIINPKPDEWYSQEAWLKAFEEIASNIGPNTLFSIGKAIPENAIFPPDIDNLEKALNSINIAYHMNHRGGEIGYYKVVSFDWNERKAVMECKNPYPRHFDRGIITTMVRRFKPEDSLFSEVVLDTSKPNRLLGAESCFYLITW